MRAVNIGNTFHQNRELREELWRYIETKAGIEKEQQNEQMWREYEDWKVHAGINFSLQVEEEIRMFEFWKNSFNKIRTQVLMILFRQGNQVLPIIIKVREYLNPETLEYEVI